VWTPRPWVATTIRRTEGQAERKRVPRGSHAAFEVRAGRDPITILQAQEADRLQDLVPLRHGRMAASPFAYYRGTPAVMAFDLAETPPTEIVVQASGDAHLSNFGIYASPERQLVFDANDFDETIPVLGSGMSSAWRQASSWPIVATASRLPSIAQRPWLRCARTASG
jgi:uncharacterized protein (DUF2252 family)